MSPHSTYETLRQFADSWGLVATFVLFVVLVAWPFRPGARKANEEAANMIFAEDNRGGDYNGE
ncbi:MAG: cbb3-type cytochrome c oxidase subunit 3 [Novosphingobium sp.]|uniref:cbb3-type cytochrome oxidase subunit 3 n=1 Tax=Novosphingobium sp. TaxID=1874826 RepID=UPI001D8D0D1C|nr:cbb3-type cytochrome c oxidase subunit 3 [Novosphingobium sp.]MCB2058327.1 cbb3-type cytochrome c oxidase subunit 3 [Novosphingobium sp.]MCP5385610.1 cbb3-type cytochrome c oxidase subunit 3 [Novosphingobium sp.]HNJ48182.1 cbb3-type cytochrome c oxidase subunit 3 [Novosphingobium sp.]HNN56282.1 cbb3-type cytochrome c oxidase subunit 3 [Novosphingobium sp.]